MKKVPSFSGVMNNFEDIQTMSELKMSCVHNMCMMWNCISICFLIDLFAEYVWICFPPIEQSWPFMENLGNQGS